jgi:transcriptional regulator GlxA family with amidase domain
VSARTFYYGFKQHRNATPMKYLKQLRLMARDALLTARVGGGRIGDVAASCGSANLSPFSRDYREPYGESRRTPCAVGFNRTDPPHTAPPSRCSCGRPAASAR